MPRPCLYVRLSREDLKAPGSTDEKLARHVATAQQLAAAHGLTVAEGDVFVERASGGSLDKRPGILTVLARCADGTYSHIVTSFSDRLLRGSMADVARVEAALLDGGVTLIASDGVTRFDDTYGAAEELTFAVKSAAARHYLRDVAAKMRAANIQRAKQGLRSQGTAPYGYTWNRTRQRFEVVADLTLTDPQTARDYARAHALPVFVTDRDYLPGARREPGPPAEGTRFDPETYVALARHQGQPGGAVLPGLHVAGPYAVVCEVWARIRTVGAHVLAVDFTRRGIPTPGAARQRSNTGAAWSTAAVFRLLDNPVYCGRPARRATVDRRGVRRDLPRAEWTLAEHEGDYPHPARLADYEAVRQRIAGRDGGHTRSRGPVPERPLTGTLRCGRGGSMHAAVAENGVPGYVCTCGDKAASHPGMRIPAYRAEAALFAALDALAAAIPPGALAARAPAARPDRDAYDAAHAEWRRRTEALRDLEKTGALFAATGNTAAFAATLASARAEALAAEAALAAILPAPETPDAGEARSAVAALLEWGAEAVWGALPSDAARRQVVGLFVERMTVVSPERPRQYARHVTVVFRPYWQEWAGETPKTFDTAELRPLRPPTRPKARGGAAKTGESS